MAALTYGKQVDSLIPKPNRGAQGKIIPPPREQTPQEQAWGELTIDTRNTLRLHHPDDVPKYDSFAEENLDKLKKEGGLQGGVQQQKTPKKGFLDRLTETADHLGRAGAIGQ